MMINDGFSGGFLMFNNGDFMVMWLNQCYKPQKGLGMVSLNPTCIKMVMTGGW